MQLQTVVSLLYSTCSSIFLVQYCNHVHLLKLVFHFVLEPKPDGKILRVNGDENRAAKRARYKADPDKQKAASRACYKAHRDENRAAKHARYLVNPEKEKAAARMRYVKSAAAKVKWHRKYSAKHRGRICASRRSRYALGRCKETVCEGNTMSPGGQSWGWGCTTESL